MVRSCVGAIATILVLLATAQAAAAVPAAGPNILWIVVEDASPNLSCYGETTIQTPHLDRLARDGVRFANAFITCPVCSPSRSAMISGMYQTTLAAHNHRSCNQTDKAGGNSPYYDSYRVPESIRLVPELFADAGYHVVNGGTAKTDYNFLPRRPLYQFRDWADRSPGQPFFAQIQLRGGKFRRARVSDPVDPADVTLPPYYPDHPVLREDWAEYLNSWIHCDQEVGRILERLRDEGLLDETIVFFWTDHGISHLRGKQFLYDEGMRVPLIVRFPDGRGAGTVREDLVSHIDIAAASLDLAGLAIPDYVQGRPLFAKDHQPRDRVFSARDRCDETVDCIRAVRTARFKYIRNFLSHRAHMQPNQYKDGKQITQTMRQLLRDGELNELQARIFQPVRPTEELYDLASDPHEIVNLAGRPEYRETLGELRQCLYDWMVETRDLGLVPEPILEDLGRQHGSKYAVLRTPENQHLIRDLIAVIERGEQGDLPALQQALRSDQAAVRYWAAVWLGNVGSSGAQQPAGALAALQQSLADPDPAVRIAAARGIALSGPPREALAILEREVHSENLLAGMYALRALEDLGPKAAPALDTIRAARQSPYDGTARIARRLAGTLAD